MIKVEERMLNSVDFWLNDIRTYIYKGTKSTKGTKKIKLKQKESRIL